MTLRYYINVLPREELREVDYYQAIKKYCGAKNGNWRISESQPDDSSPLALLSGAFDDPANWYGTASLQSLALIPGRVLDFRRGNRDDVRHTERETVQ
jgi:hypothetical protein